MALLLALGSFPATGHRAALGAAVPTGLWQDPGADTGLHQVGAQ